MSSLLNAVRRGFEPGCLESGRLRKEGCSVSLRGTPTDRVVIDLDKPSSPLSGEETRCDYLVFAQDRGQRAWFVPLELKRGAPRPSRLVAQLRAGADAAVEGVGPCPVNFVPVAAVGGIHKADLTKLKKNANKVGFGGQRKTVRVMRCGGKLVDVLKLGNR
jgi:hypothetical protein